MDSCCPPTTGVRIPVVVNTETGAGFKWMVEVWGTCTSIYVYIAMIDATAAICEGIMLAKEPPLYVLLPI